MEIFLLPIKSNFDQREQQVGKQINIAAKNIIVKLTGWGLVVFSVVLILLLLIPFFVKYIVLPPLSPPPQVEIVLDISRRMGEPFDESGQTKLDVARDAILKMLTTLEVNETEVSLRVIGGQGTQGCEVYPLSLMVGSTDDYAQIRQELQTLNTSSVKDVPLSNTVNLARKHLRDSGSPAQTVIIYTGGDDTCGYKFQDFINNIIADTISSKTFVIALKAEDFKLKGTETHEVFFKSAQTAEEVQAETDKVIDSLPPTPIPPPVLREVSQVADRVEDFFISPPPTPTPRPSPTPTLTSTPTPAPLAGFVTFTPTSAPVEAGTANNNTQPGDGVTSTSDEPAAPPPQKNLA